jgi:hypothetical protein
MIIELNISSIYIYICIYICIYIYIYMILYMATTSQLC